VETGNWLCYGTKMHPSNQFHTEFQKFYENDTITPSGSCSDPNSCGKDGMERGEIGIGTGRE